MSRETEKVLKELQRFLDSHADEIKCQVVSIIMNLQIF